MSIFVLHNGLMEDCQQCNPHEREAKEKKVKVKMTSDLSVRREVAEELGEDPREGERFQMLQKYGIAAPRIDREVRRPKWMKVSSFKRKLNEWIQATKGRTRRSQQHFRPSIRPQNQSPSIQGTRNFRPNSDPTRTGITPRSPRNS